MKHLFSILSLLGLSCNLIACSSQIPVATIKKEKKAYSVAYRQIPPQPTYGATRWVRPPTTFPSRKFEDRSSSYVSPVVHYKVTEAPLKEAALVLAAITRYKSYCSSAIADQKVTIDTLGTLDELAQEIEVLTGIKVVVDHDNKEIRFLGSNKQA